MKYFYAYHGPENQDPFNSSGGYWFKSDTKLKKLEIGDSVFVIQCLGQESKKFKLCGLYHISGLEFNAKPMFKRMHGVSFSTGNYSDLFVDLDEEQIGKLLPEISEGNTNWSNFKKHFCAQGASFRNPLSEEVVKVLMDVLKKESPNSAPDENPETDYKKIAYLNSERRKEIEQKAIQYVINKYQTDGYNIEDCQAHNCGYDLLATKGSERLELEVKGTSSNAPRFFISRNEYKYAKQEKNKYWRLIVIYDIDKNPKELELTRRQMEEKFSMEELCWECTPKE